MGISDDFAKQEALRKQRHDELEKFCLECLVGVGLIAGLTLVFLVMFL